jgi:hypothetical protein
MKFIVSAIENGAILKPGDAGKVQNTNHRIKASYMRRGEALFGIFTPTSR